MPFVDRRHRTTPPRRHGAALVAPGTRPDLLERTVNGQPGLVAQRDGLTVMVFAFDIAADRITHIWAVHNPAKLRPWTTG